eukprot:m51a1_g13487 putative calpain-type cysteine protease dek1 (490) ;mRNA; f:208-2182
MEPLHALTSPAAPGPPWVALLEKAYAKLYGSYEAISRPGHLTEALHDLTGASVTSVAVGASSAPESDSEMAWQLVLQSLHDGHVVAALRASGTAEGEHPGASGIACNAAHAVLGAQEVEGGTRVVVVRDPWGRTRWQGRRWSEGSPELIAGPQQLRSVVHALAGAFVCTWEDFHESFTELVVCRTQRRNERPLRAFALAGEWRGQSAGGCANHATWGRNPQFGLELAAGEAEAAVHVALSQADALADRARYHEVGLHLCRGIRGRRKDSVCDLEIVATSGPFSRRRDVSASAVLKPGSYYVVVPSAFEPGSEGRFFISVTSTAGVVLKSLAPAKASAGACSVCGGELSGGHYSLGPGVFACAKCYDSSSKKCSYCDGRFYHMECFRCSSCGRSASKNPVLAGERLYCAQCGAPCAACGEPCGKESVEALGQPYHPGCFRCSKCGAALQVGEFFVLDGATACEACANPPSEPEEPMEQQSGPVKGGVAAH